jgi:hypothetical protein
VPPGDAEAGGVANLRELEARIRELEVRIHELTFGGPISEGAKTDGCTHGCTGACPDPTDGCTHGCTYGCTNGCTKGCGEEPLDLIRQGAWHSPGPVDAIGQYVRRAAP